MREGAAKIQRGLERAKQLLVSCALAAYGCATMAGCAKAAELPLNGAVNGALSEATSPKSYANCVAALAHVKGCDARFPERDGLCVYSSGGECAPYINAEQTQCLQEATCETVRVALDQRGWLCGMLAAGAGIVRLEPQVRTTAPQ